VNVQPQTRTMRIAAAFCVHRERGLELVEEWKRSGDELDEFVFAEEQEVVDVEEKSV